jgi:hypothetical protein
VLRVIEPKSLKLVASPCSQSPCRSLLVFEEVASDRDDENILLPYTPRFF